MICSCSTPCHAVPVHQLPRGLELSTTRSRHADMHIRTNPRIHAALCTVLRPLATAGRLVLGQCVGCQCRGLPYHNRGARSPRTCGLSGDLGGFPGPTSAEPRKSRGRRAFASTEPAQWARHRTPGCILMIDRASTFDQFQHRKVAELRWVGSESFFIEDPEC